MMLTGDEILRRKDRDIVITPWREENINPNSYNLTLAPEIEVFDNRDVLDMRKDVSGMKMTIPEMGLIIQPHQLILGVTEEWTETYNLVPKLDGRSSIARLGILVHMTAGFGDIGFKGRWTLEISCIVPVRIYPGVKICQISYETICGEVNGRVYDGKYQNSLEPGRSKFHEETHS